MRRMVKFISKMKQNEFLESSLLIRETTEDTIQLMWFNIIIHLSYNIYVQYSPKHNMSSRVKKERTKDTTGAMQVNPTLSPHPYIKFVYCIVFIFTNRVFLSNI